MNIIKITRLNKCISIEELAECAKLPIYIYCYYEDQCIFTIDQYKAICKKLEISFDAHL